jgi:predicted DNA-binding protein with PD1-like motif
MKFFNIKRVRVIRIEEGKELMETLKKECQDVNGGLVFAIGGIERAKVSVFDPEKGKYNTTEVKGFHEVVSLLGNISRKKGNELFLHLHITLASKKKVIAGHLMEAYVRPTLEVVVLEFDKKLERTIESRGLFLLDV